MMSDMRDSGNMWASSGARAAMVGLFLVTAACSDRDNVSVGHSRTTVATSSAPSTSAVDPRIVDWLSRIRGHTVSYIAIVSSHTCDICGTWTITELDGVIAHAKFMDQREIRSDARPLTLTAALTEATTTTGRVTVVGSSATAIRVQVNVGTDGEFGYDAQMIAVRR